MGVERTLRTCISTGTILSRFGKPLLYFPGLWRRGSTPPVSRSFLSQAPPITLLQYLLLHDYLRLAHRAYYNTSLQTLRAYDSRLSVRLYLLRIY
jgi:hypothetical protein